MLNFLVLSKSPLHFGHFTFFSEITLSNSSRPALSGMAVLVASIIILSALYVDLNFVHLTMGSAKLAKWPDASNTD